MVVTKCDRIEYLRLFVPPLFKVLQEKCLGNSCYSSVSSNFTRFYVDFPDVCLVFVDRQFVTLIILFLSNLFFELVISPKGL